LFTTSGKGRGRVKWERAEVLKRVEREGGGYGGAGNGNARKNIPKTRHVWHLGTTLGGYY